MIWPLRCKSFDTSKIKLCIQQGAKLCLLRQLKWPATANHEGGSIHEKPKLFLARASVCTKKKIIHQCLNVRSFCVQYRWLRLFVVFTMIWPIRLYETNLCSTIQVTFFSKQSLDQSVWWLLLRFIHSQQQQPPRPSCSFGRGPSSPDVRTDIESVIE